MIRHLYITLYVHQPSPGIWSVALFLDATQQLPAENTPCFLELSPPDQLTPKTYFLPNMMKGLLAKSALLSGCLGARGRRIWWKVQIRDCGNPLSATRLCCLGKCDLHVLFHAWWEVQGPPQDSTNSGANSSGNIHFSSHWTHSLSPSFPPVVDTILHQNPNSFFFQAQEKIAISSPLEISIAMCLALAIELWMEMTCVTFR